MESGPQQNKVEENTRETNLEAAAESYKSKFEIAMRELLDRIGRDPYFKDIQDRHSI